MMMDNDDDDDDRVLTRLRLEAQVSVDNWVGGGSQVVAIKQGVKPTGGDGNGSGQVAMAASSAKG